MEKPAPFTIKLDVDSIGSFDYESFNDNMTPQQCMDMLKSEI